MGEIDLTRFADIPDPFAGVASAAAGLVPAELPFSAGRARVLALRVAAVVVALGFEAACVALVERRPDWRSLAPANRMLGLALPLAGAALALGAVVRRGRWGLGKPAAEVLVLASLAPAVFVLGALFGGARGAEAAFWSHAVPCILMTGVLTAGPLALGVWSLRQAFAAASAWRTAALGVACGALAAGTMSLVCPDGESWHVIVGHGAAMLVGGLAGALLGRLTRA